MDRALWITWYDLPDVGREAYIAWLQGSYMPRLLAKPGILWAAHFASDVNAPLLYAAHTDAAGKPRAAGAPRHLHHTEDVSVPTGNAFILLFGAADAHAFARPAPDEFQSELTQEDRKMLAMRIGERVNIMIDEAQMDGPDAGQRQPGTALSPCIQVMCFNADWKDEDELLAWYARGRMPAMSKLPGCVGTRKLVSVSGWAKHGVLYEFASVEARNAHFPGHEKLNPAMEAWTRALVPKLIHAPGSPNVARRIWSAVK